MKLFTRSKTKLQDRLFAVEKELQEYRSKLEAIDRSQAVIEFELDGSVIGANDNFLTALGYRLDEIVGKHHRIFVDPQESSTAAYRGFWESFQRGEFHSGRFRRIRKDGSEIWIQAMYYSLVDAKGRPTKVVKFACDVTDQVKLEHQSREVSRAVSEGIGNMVHRIEEIGDCVADAVSMAKSTNVEAETTADSVRRLDASSQSIEHVVELIRGLAEQTNLLALNATIESARAGSAGKGFSVVANEVKELAKQTTDATENIDRSVTEIRALIRESVDSISLVSSNVGKVAESVASVASAVEEQSDTMKSLDETTSSMST